MLGLRYLHAYCPNSFSASHAPAQIPLEFWSIDDDDLYPIELHEDLSVPEGFRLAPPIFAIEDDYHFNGWTALLNQQYLLPSVISAV